MIRLLRFVVELVPAALLFVAIHQIMQTILSLDVERFTLATVRDIALAGTREVCAEHWPNATMEQVLGCKYF